MRRIRWNEGGGRIKSGKGHEHTCTRTRVPILPTCVYCFCVCCALGKLLTGCQVQPGLQNLCDHLLLPLWPADTQIYTSMSVCVLLSVRSYSVEDVWLFSASHLFFFFFFGHSQACMQDLSLCRHPPWWVRHVTGPTTWLFHRPLFRWAILQQEWQED